LTLPVNPANQRESEVGSMEGWTSGLCVQNKEVQQ